MQIYIKRVYDPVSSNDGTRVLVDRVWPRGMTKAQVNHDLWLKDIAPSNELRKWFGHDPGRWDEFQARYQAELSDNPKAVDTLVNIEGTVTLLYSAKDTARNQAVVIKAFLDARYVSE